MSSSDVWSMIAGERNALAGDLGSLTDAQWKTPSLCSEWAVRDVLGHMTATAEMTPGKFFSSMIGSGFSLTKLQNKEIAEQNEGTPADTLRRFTDIVDSRKHPPGPVDSWLGETLVHAEDIRRPLGIKHAYSTEAATRTLDFYRKSNLIIGGKKRAGGLTLRATDTDWSAGSGPEVSGPAISLMLAVTGRRAALADLSGDGLETLRERMP
jgi:uncharacterized protein (TIGR03083 family)